MSQAQCRGVRRTHLLLGLALFLGVALLYAPVTSHEFVNYDDDTYVTANDAVRAGLSARGVAWAFTTFRASNWHPLTWLSHMLDVELFGLSPGGHHLVSLLFHAANALLLLVILRAATGALWASVAAAALFALHPLRVESVAWAAERKDVLSVLFGLLAIAAYLRYVRKEGPRRFAAVAVLHACSLLAKPTLVTLPALLLLLDFWPLGRFGGPAAAAAAAIPRRSAGRLVAEKAPLAVLSLASSAVTLHAQSLGGTLSHLATYPLGERLANVVTHFGRYLGTSLWPSRLSVFYPLEEGRWDGRAAGILALLALIGIAAVAARRRLPYLATGWFWFLGALVPVCGLVQVGAHSVADRYTYLPSMGLSVLAAWGGRELAVRHRLARRLLPPLAVALSLALAVATSRQLRVWRDSVTLFRHAATVTEGNWVAQYRLGLALEGLGRTEEAAGHYREVLLLRPHDGWAFYRLGGLAMQAGKDADAFDLYRRALGDPAAPPETENNLGVLMARQNRLVEAEAYYRRALERRPGYHQARVNLGLTLAATGRREEALAAVREVLREEPGHPGALAAERLVLGGDAAAAR